MENEQSELIKLLNSSGFPFQIGVRREIERTSSVHGWNVEAEEHHWHHPESNSTGFSDLIISHKQLIYTAVLECKRVKEHGKWLFLTPNEQSDDKKRISALCTNIQSSNSKSFLGWADFDFNPPTPEAAYCVLHGQDEKKPMLERIADDLLPAVESIGYEYTQIHMSGRFIPNPWRLFFPIIVTNAILHTTTFNADSVSMASGLLDLNSCDFKPVPFVRFRKSLATHYPKVGIRYGSSKTLAKASLAKETTVLVIHSAALADHLQLLDIPLNQEAVFGNALSKLNRESLGEHHIR